MAGEPNEPLYTDLADRSPAGFNAVGRGRLPGLLGVEVVSTEASALRARLDVTQPLMAPNGFLHAATVIALADTLCGYGTVVNLPEGAAGFTTVELKSNFLGTVREGAIECLATPLHLGGTTHVWDAVVDAEGTGRRLAVFRCTQLVLWPR